MDIQPIGIGQEPQPPESIRFLNVNMKLQPDHRRVRVSIQLTPFISPPDIEIEVKNSSNSTVASATIIGVSEPIMEVTLHLRGEVEVGEYSFDLTVGYQDLPDVDRQEVTLFIPEVDSDLES